MQDTMKKYISILFYCIICHVWAKDTSTQSDMRYLIIPNLQKNKEASRGRRKGSGEKDTGSRLPYPGSPTVSEKEPSDFPQEIRPIKGLPTPETIPGPSHRTQLPGKRTGFSERKVLQKTGRLPDPEHRSDR